MKESCQILPVSVCCHWMVNRSQFGIIHPFHLLIFPGWRPGFIFWKLTWKATKKTSCKSWWNSENRFRMYGSWGCSKDVPSCNGRKNEVKSFLNAKWRNSFHHFTISLFRYFAISLFRYFATSLLRYFATSLFRYFAICFGSGIENWTRDLRVMNPTL